MYVNLKGKYPGGIVEPEDYEKVRGRIIDALLDYKHPETGERPVLLAVRKEDAHVFGMGGAQAGDGGAFAGEIKKYLVNSVKELMAEPLETLLGKRYAKLRSFGQDAVVGK